MGDEGYKPVFETANATLGAPGFGATTGIIAGGHDALANLMHTNPATGLPYDFTPAGWANEAARPLGLNWSSDPLVRNYGGQFNDLTAPAAEGAATAGSGAEVAPATEGASSGANTAATAAGEMNALGALAGGVGRVGGGMALASGGERMFHGLGADGTNQDIFHGLGDVVGGVTGMVGGAAGLATGLGATAASAGLAGGLAAAAPIAAPIAAAVGLMVSGDHHAEEMGIFGVERNPDGTPKLGAGGKPINRGAFEAARDTGPHARDAASDALGGGTVGLIGGALTAGVSTVGLEAGAAVADLGLGIDSLGASSGLFGVGHDEAGRTYNKGAFEAMDG